MKRLTVLLAIMAFSNMIAFAQKKYEMVIEKTDGTNITINTEDIIRTYFRERKNGHGDTSQAYLSCPDDNHPHMIDLGLPSGTLWACCNVGATTPEGYGGYYAWGETEEKDYYDWSTYIHCDGTPATCHDLGSDIAGTQYDVAHVKWGGGWQMPSCDQFEELIRYCSFEWTTSNNCFGLKLTATNAGTIFLPAGGSFFEDVKGWNINSNCLFWSSTPYPITYYAYGLYTYLYGDPKGSVLDFQRRRGYNVRPVWVP